MNTGVRISLLIPVRNEATILEQLVIEIESANLRNIECLLVLDNCTDDSEEILEKIHLSDRFSYMKNVNQSGYGSAVRSGLHHLNKRNFDWCIVMDSDLSNPIRDIQKFLHVIEALDNEPHILLIKGNRFPGRNKLFLGVPLKRKIFSFSANVISKTMIGGNISDPTNGFRAVRVSNSELIDTTEVGFSQIVEEFWICKRIGGGILEIESALRYDLAIRTKSQFTFDVGTALAYLKYIFRCLKFRFNQ